MKVTTEACLRSQHRSHLLKVTEDISNSRLQYRVRVHKSIIISLKSNSANEILSN